MKLYIIITAILLTFCSKSQNNVLNPNSSWHCKDLDGVSQCKDTENYNVYFNGDSIINGNQYLKLYKKGFKYNSLFLSGFCTNYNQYFNTFYGLVRYYQNILYTLNGNTESVFINYNLQIGDSIKNVLFTTTPLKINRIDSINVNGNYLNRFFYKSTNSLDTGYVMEQIGSNHGFISLYTPFFESSKKLYCYAENNIELYSDPINGSGNCNLTLSIKANYDNHEKIKLHPNPVTKTLTVETEYLTKKIKILNYFGQIVFEDTIEGTIKTITLSELKSGIYFILLETETETIIKKIIKE